jgi:hypothetical protein
MYEETAQTGLPSPKRLKPICGIQTSLKQIEVVLSR